jgi:hypothetical protein
MKSGLLLVLLANYIIHFAALKVFICFLWTKIILIWIIVVLLQLTYKRIKSSIIFDLILDKSALKSLKSACLA